MNAISKIAGVALASTPKTLEEVVDQLGIIKADIATSEETEASLRRQLIESGKSCVSGQLYDATIANVSRETVEAALMKAYIARTPAGKKWLKANTVEKIVPTVRVVARTAPREGNKAA